MTILLWIALTLVSIASVLFLVAWWRARPGSSEAIFGPAVLVQVTAMFVGMLPQLFAPKLETVRNAGSVASIVLTVVAFIIYRRRLRAIKRA